MRKKGKGGEKVSKQLKRKEDPCRFKKKLFQLGRGGKVIKFSLGIVRNCPSLAERWERYLRRETKISTSHSDVKGGGKKRLFVTKKAVPPNMRKGGGIPSWGKFAPIRSQRRAIFSERRGKGKGV